MSEFTAEFIKAQRELAAKAIDTPWKSDNCVIAEYDNEITIFAPWGGRVKAGNAEAYGDYRGAQIAKLYHQGENAAVVTEGQAVANAAYIVTAANNYPAALDEIERLREAQRWIPVSEEPDPSTCTDVYETEYAWTGRYWTRFLLDDNVFFGPGEYDFNRGLWFSIDMRGSEIDLAVTHYMLLPQPPQEAEGN